MVGNLLQAAENRPLPIERKGRITHRIGKANRIGVVFTWIRTIVPA